MHTRGEPGYEGTRLALTAALLQALLYSLSRTQGKMVPANKAAQNIILGLNFEQDSRLMRVKGMYF